MNHSKHGNIIIKTIIVIAIIIVFITLYILFSTYKILKPDIPLEVLNNNIIIDNNITLVDQNGRSFKGDDLKGHLSLIYFGAVPCSNDYESLNKLSEIYKILQHENISINIIFITLDPQHDTSKVLKKYLQQFNKNFIGLTGSPENIDKIAHNFRVFYHKKVNQPTGAECSVEHSPFVYLINSEGKFLTHYCLSIPTE